MTIEELIEQLGDMRENCETHQLDNQPTVWDRDIIAIDQLIEMLRSQATEVGPSMYRVTVYTQASGTVTSEFFTASGAKRHLIEHAHDIFNSRIHEEPQMDFPDLYAPETLEEMQALLKTYALPDWVVAITEHDLTLREELDQLTGGNEHGNKI